MSTDLHDWLKSQPFIMIASNPWSKKRDNYFSCIELLGGLKGIHCRAQNAALFVDLL